MGYINIDKKRQYQKEWMRKRRESFFKGKICTTCGSIKKLELDHIDLNTKTSNRIWSWSKERRDKEIAKCQVLCYGCHKKKTIEEKSKPLVHGTYNGYYAHKCRCRICKDFNRDRIRIQRYKWQGVKRLSLHGSRPKTLG